MDVRRLTEDDVEAAAGVLARAFYDYPMWTWILPDEEHRRRALPHMMRASVRWGLLMGEMFGLGKPLRAVAIWAPPGMADHDVDPDGSRTGWHQVEEALGADAMSRFETFIAAQRTLRDRDIPSRGWYLPWLGVDPESQRSGAGAALLTDMFERLDAEDRSIYLETEKAANVPYYIRHGFVVVHEGVIPDGGPGFWTMRRNSR